ncbi:hypothetical protein BJV74DRAFT_902761 [Russula compacta]|nr:hypothetical protein BJV74DRAFT_902761 [Russula compacta]
MGPEWTACDAFDGVARDVSACASCPCLPTCLSAFKTDILHVRLFPLTPFSPVGIDCTDLPGVADVACLSGKMHRPPLSPRMCPCNRRHKLHPQVLENFTFSYWRMSLSLHRRGSVGLSTSL